MMTLNDMRVVLLDVEFVDFAFLIRSDGARPYLQVAFTAPCNTTGEVGHQGCRKWFLSPHMTKSELVQTAFKAVLTAVEHEAREKFLYRGQSIFDPHYDVDRLFELRRQSDALDERKPVNTA